MDEEQVRSATISIRADIDLMISELGQLENFIETVQASTIHMDAASSVRRTVDTLHAALVLCDQGLYSSALVLCRTGFEQSLGNILNLRETNLVWFYTFNTMEGALAWAETTRETLSDVTDIARIDSPKVCDREGSRYCVPLVLRNLMTQNDGVSRSPFPGARLLAVVDRHRHELSTGGDTFRGLLYPYIGDREAVKDQKHHYRHHFTRHSLIEAIRIHVLLNQSDIEKLNRHYNYLSLFSHGTSNTDEYLNLRGQPKSRRGGVVKALILLYVYCILETELHSFEIFIEASEGVELKQIESSRISRLKGSNRRSWLGFASADPHLIDIFREKSYRSDLKLADTLGRVDNEVGYIRSDNREFFDTNFLTRVNDAMSSTRDLMSGDSYTPPDLN